VSGLAREFFDGAAEGRRIVGDREFQEPRWAGDSVRGPALAERDAGDLVDRGIDCGVADATDLLGSLELAVGIECGRGLVADDHRDGIDRPSVRIGVAASAARSRVLEAGSIGHLDLERGRDLLDRVEAKLLARSAGRHHRMRRWPARHPSAPDAPPIGAPDAPQAARNKSGTTAIRPSVGIPLRRAIGVASRRRPRP